MVDTNFASLSPRLLARKGGAKPAMRSQAGPLGNLAEKALSDDFDDLGWNDMGHDVEADSAGAVMRSAQIIHLDAGNDDQHLTAPAAAKPIRQPRRQSALERGQRAAFTLRLDAERHFRLRLASTVKNISAQQLVTEALDALLAELPEIDKMAQQADRK